MKKKVGVLPYILTYPHLHLYIHKIKPPTFPEPMFSNSLYLSTPGETEVLSFNPRFKFVACGNTSANEDEEDEKCKKNQEHSDDDWVKEFHELNEELQQHQNQLVNNKNEDLGESNKQSSENDIDEATNQRNETHPTREETHETSTTDENEENSIHLPIMKSVHFCVFTLAQGYRKICDYWRYLFECVCTGSIG